LGPALVSYGFLCRKFNVVAKGCTTAKHYIVVFRVEMDWGILRRF